MPILEDFPYSREKCVQAIHNYYKFLSELYLDDTLILEPPEDGWPSVTLRALQDLHKTDEVVALLRHLPYIQRKFDVKGAPGCKFADWQENCSSLHDESSTAYAHKTTTEDPIICDRIPAHIIGLTQGPRDTPIFLLDTEQGAVHWWDCPIEVWSTAAQEESHKSDRCWTTYDSNSDGMAGKLQTIYREHGWQDLQLHRKEECMEAVKSVTRAHDLDND
ncbi:hypothetical protein EK21DRAFT_95744 [Setomelanomma holmii]|uniref:Uncharacterized protein n=1 Tax=Setomelanomma holmii TaxID=210430 RepID=A0A9P4HLE0_9PLEO|nr:hypothetical protein EK21DRAFT_95744 [Setomelanomma holmii]